jgi:rubrerythrin
MVGVIRGWDVLTHPIVTIRCFGWRVFFQAIVPWQKKPFLSLISSRRAGKPAVSSIPTILDRCIELELRAKRIYAALGKAFEERDDLSAFFSGLAAQEQRHADLLAICRVAAVEKGWRAKLFNPWEDYLPRLEKQMDAIEANIRCVDSVEAALRLVVEVESAEVNTIFHAALEATDARFVKKLRPFRRAMEAHMDYIIATLPRLSPRLILLARELRRKFPEA